MSLPFGAIQPSEIAALSATIAIYGALIPTSIAKNKHEKERSALLVASFCGAALSIAALLSAPPVRYAAWTYFGLFVAANLALVLLRGLRRKEWRWPAAVAWVWERPKSILYGLGLALVAALGTVLGAATLGDGSTHVTTLPPPSGQYRISGTCVNGSCYVNECETPAVCGSDNEGELKEETAVDIVCQIRGEMAEAPNGKRSFVWDRLSTSLYVSDLFVSGTRSGSFAKLPRCANA